MSESACFNICFTPVTIEHALGLIIRDNTIKLFKKEKLDRLYYIFKDKESEILYESFCENQGGNPYTEVNKEKFLKSELSHKSVSNLLSTLNYEYTSFSSSKSEEEDVQSTTFSDTIEFYSKTIQYMKYPTIKKASDITLTKFMSDKDYTINELFE